MGVWQGGILSLMMQTEEQARAQLIEELTLLNDRLQKQNRLSRVFLAAIIHGIGFFIGSAILAVIALGILGPAIGNIGWIQDNFNRGSAIIHEK